MDIFFFFLLAMVRWSDVFSRLQPGIHSLTHSLTHSIAFIALLRTCTINCFIVLLYCSELWNLAQTLDRSDSELRNISFCIALHLLR